MIDLKTVWQVVRVATVAGASAMIACSCISADVDSNTTQVTPQGTVQLEKIRAGMPEEIFRNARITFAVDTKMEATKGGKTQYLSRTYNSKQGQYMIQCHDDKCFLLQVLYNKPIDKADGLATLPNLVPPTAPAENFVDDSVLKNPKTTMASEYHYFGNKSLAIVNYSDKTGKEISSISVYALPPEKALSVAYGKVPAALHVPAESKGDPTVADAGAPEDKKQH